MPATSSSSSDAARPRPSPAVFGTGSSCRGTPRPYSLHRLVGCRPALRLHHHRIEAGPAQLQHGPGQVAGKFYRYGKGQSAVEAGCTTGPLSFQAENLLRSRPMKALPHTAAAHSSRPVSPTRQNAQHTNGRDTRAVASPLSPIPLPSPVTLRHRTAGWRARPPPGTSPWPPSPCAAARPPLGPTRGGALVPSLRGGADSRGAAPGRASRPPAPRRTRSRRVFPSLQSREPRFRPGRHRRWS
jgi:hypothetical protein